MRNFYAKYGIYVLFHAIKNPRNYVVFRNYVGFLSVEVMGLEPTVKPLFYKAFRVPCDTSCDTLFGQTRYFDKVFVYLFRLADSLQINDIPIHSLHDIIRCPSAALEDVLIRDADSMHDAGCIVP